MKMPYLLKVAKYAGTDKVDLIENEGIWVLFYDQSDEQCP